MGFINPVNLGTGTAAGTTSVSLATGSTVPAGGLILVGFSVYLNGSAASSISLAGGSLTWAKDAAKQGSIDSNRYAGVWSAQAPSGLASGTTLTLSKTGTGFNWCLCAAYTTGQDTTTALDAAGAGNTGAGSVTSWSSGNVVTATANTLLWGVGHMDGLVTSTPGTGWTELHDFQNGGDSVTLTSVYQIVSSTGTYAAAGTWSTTTSNEWVSDVAAYKQAGGGGGGTTVKQLAALGVG